MVTINVGSWSDKVRAFFGIQGGNPIPTTRDLQPVVVVESDRPEWYFAGGEKLCGTNRISNAPPAGEFAFFALVNPESSGVLLILELVKTAPDVTQPVLISRVPPQNVAAAAPFLAGENSQSQTENFLRDARWRGSVPSIVLTDGDMTAGQTALVGAPIARVSNGDRYDLPIIIPPDGAIVVWAENATSVIQATIAWRERPLHKGVRG